MKTSECRRLVRKHTLHLMRVLSIQQWRIDFVYEEIKAEDVPAKFTVLMSTDLHYRYQKAMITINSSPIENEKDFLQSLRHELIHVALVSFSAYDDFARTLMPTHTDWVSLNKIYHDRYEELVLQIERMLDFGFGQTPEKMVATARRRWGEQIPKRRKKKRSRR